MVLSYEEACKKMDKAEGVSKKITERYAYGRCYYLISIGKLKTAEFDLYIKTDQGFQDIGKQLTGFVTAESVDKLISEREPLLREKGITRKGMAIVAKFQDGTESTFLTKGECCKFFGIHPKDMKKYIGTKLAYTMKINTARVIELENALNINLSESEPQTELIYFEYANKTK